MPQTHPLLQLLGAWGAASSAERYRIVTETTADPFYYADPHSGPLHDRAAFLGFLNTFRTRLPDGEVAAEGAIDQHEGHARLAFSVRRAGEPVRQGVYFAELSPEGKVARLIGFLE